MAITPVEIRHIRLKKGLRGYRAAPVERLLADIAEDFEEVWRQRADLSDKVEQLESDLQRHRELEGLLRTDARLRGALGAGAEGSGAARGRQHRGRGAWRGARGHAPRGRRARAARSRGAADPVAPALGARGRRGGGNRRARARRRVHRRDPQADLLGRIYSASVSDSTTRLRLCVAPGAAAGGEETA